MSHETFKAPEPEQLAELLPAYEFESFIAQGGMGAVYKARQKSLDREVAIKILPRELGADPEFHASFETEAKAMAKLNHPNLLGIYDFGSVDDMPYIVMELVRGKSLYHSAWNKVIEPGQAIGIVRGICDGLGHAHEHGILHGDIKPANILLTPKAQPKIGDFGLAQHAGTTRSGAIMGTPGYAAPELTLAPETVGKGTDLYAVGVILHELITGQRPDPLGEETPKPFGDHGLDAIWQKATTPIIANRYASADEMSAALAAWKPTSRRRTRRLNTGAGAVTSTAPRQLVVQPTTATLPCQPAQKPAQKPAASPVSRPPVRPTPTAGNGSLARNLLIIAFLIAVVGFGYKLLQGAKTHTDTDQNQPKKERVVKTPAMEPDGSPQDPATAADAIPVSKTPDTDNPPPVEKDESPAESLARLKNDLAAGKRHEMPQGSQRRGSDDFLFIDSPMTWYAAQAFAEEYGAHLAIPDLKEDLSWLSGLVPDSQTIWLGSGRSGKKLWSDNDGTDWDLEDSPKGVGPFASLNNFGILRAGKADATLPFIIQWHRDGSNPATLETILERTRETFDAPNPVFPPGTVSLDTRHLLFVPLAVKRSQAQALATKAGGTLAVPASREEISWIAEQSESMPASIAYWLGGRRVEGSWTWDTGESWELSDWPDDSEPSGGGDALVIIPGKGWSIADDSQAKVGFVIEWSNDAR